MMHLIEKGHMPYVNLGQNIMCISSLIQTSADFY